ncbi:ABC transporter ATP-binding protein [Thiofilum flexile]|uniref:ABC transporter ATP-binding protein n=1 Tax=Thiofilum flexile TaxID=125627 RepID=UPI0003692057|nr:ABC transporter ATP-binding protein [Thiofilum flexile]
MISIRQVSKRYQETTVVDQVSMEIESGTITTIVGTSGSGKSTLLRMINRLTDMSEGEIWIEGRNIMSQPATELRRRMGYVIQGNGLFPHRTVAENIATVPKLLQWQASTIQERVYELLDLFDLEPKQYAHKWPHQLSGGQQQRVGVARALAARPQLLLMDEPFGALDPVIRHKAQEDLLTIQQQLGITILVVTHDMDEAFLLADKVAVMHDGKLLQYAAPEDILVNPSDPFCVQLTGTSDRALKLLSLAKAKDHLQPVNEAIELDMPAEASLRDVLSELTWRGVPITNIINAQGQRIGSIDLPQILKAGQAR